MVELEVRYSLSRLLTRSLSLSLSLSSALSFFLSLSLSLFLTLSLAWSREAGPTPRVRTKAVRDSGVRVEGCGFRNMARQPGPRERCHAWFRSLEKRVASLSVSLSLCLSISAVPAGHSSDGRWVELLDLRV
jgi:hypothetical protein